MPLVILPHVAAQEITSDFTYDASVYRNSVSGPGASQSTLPLGNHFNGEFSYSFTANRATDQFSFRILSRATDDRTINGQTWALNHFNMKLANDYRNWEIGDVYADFSQYSFNSSLKGALLSRKTTSTNSEWKLITGLAYPRWESYWGGAQYKAVKRSVQGLNFQTATGDWSYGITALSSKDSDRVQSFDELYNNKLLAINWEHSLKEGMALKGESAFSSGDLSTADGIPAINQHGYAHQLTWTHQLPHHRWAYEFERVSPSFVTLTGSAIADRERMKLNYRRSLDADTAIQFGLLCFHDRLSGSTKLDRTTVYQPELTLQLNSPFNRPDATLALRLGIDRRYNSTDSTLDKNIGINYRDIIGKYDWELSLENAWFSTKPFATGDKHHELNIFSSIGTQFKQGDATWRPSLNIGWWRNRNVLGLYSDRMSEYSLGLSYDNREAKVTSSLRIGQKHNNNTRIDDSKRWFANLNIEAQPAYLRKLGPEVKQYLRFLINDYKFDTSGNDYRETSISTGIKLGF